MLYYKLGSKTHLTYQTLTYLFLKHTFLYKTDSIVYYSYSSVNYGNLYLSLTCKCLPRVLR